MKWIREIAAYNGYGGVCSLEIALYLLYSGFSRVCSLVDAVCVHLSIPTAVLSAAITACHGSVKQMYLLQTYSWLNITPRKQVWMPCRCPHLRYAVASGMQLTQAREHVVH